MSKNVSHVAHVKSKVVTNGKPKLPTAEQLIEGEIAVNYAKNHETLSIKNESGDVVTFSSDKVFEPIISETAQQAAEQAVTGKADSSVSITAGNGLTGGGDLSADRTLSLEETGTTGTYVKVVTDEYGRVTSGNTVIQESDVDGLTGHLGAKVNSATFTAHTADTNVHTTAAEKERWDEVSGKVDTDVYTAYTAATETVLDGKVDDDDISDMATKTWVGQQGFLTEHQSLADYALSADVTTAINEATSGKADTTALTTHTSNDTIHVTSQDKTNWNAKAETSDIPSVEPYFDGVVYDSNTKRINFKHGDTVKTYVDATDFIKDGMVDNVVLSGTDLTITFNTDAGKEAIVLDTTKIFDPSNYYTTAQTDSQIASAVENKVDNTLTVTGASGLTGGGALNGNRVISHATAHAATGQTSDTAQTPAIGGTFTIPVIKYDIYGHVTATTTANVTLPASDNTNYYITGGTVSTATTSNTISLSGNNAAAHASVTLNAATTDSAGLMSSSDKTKLNGIETGAQVNTVTSVAGKTGAVTLVKGDVGLGNVDNTADANKTVAAAVSAQTADSANSVTWANVSGKPSAASAAPANVATASTVGTSSNYARQDHVHSIALATGDANGQVKIAGTNVDVKGLGSAAYKDEAYFAGSGHSHSNYVATGRTISAGTGLTGGGNLSADRTLSLATTGTAGTYYATKTDAYGRVTGGTSTLASNDVTKMTGYSKPTAEASNITTGDTLNAAIGKLEKALEDYEYVASYALNDINDRLSDELAERTEEIIDAYEGTDMVVAAALNDLNSRLSDIESAVAAIKASLASS